jgi:hypothetical protein
VTGSNGRRSASTDRRPVSINSTIAVWVVRSGSRARFSSDSIWPITNSSMNRGSRRVEARGISPSK